MTEIADDIAKAARTIASSIYFLDYEDRSAVTKYIDSAIRTERERAAKIAEDAAPVFQDMEFAPLQELSARIATAIRTQSEK